jgi:hypothetical protein
MEHGSPQAGAGVSVCPVSERTHLVGDALPDRGRQVVPDPRQDEQLGALYRSSGVPARGRPQQRVVGAVQHQGRHSQLRKPAAVPFRADLAALRLDVADAAD